MKFTHRVHAHAARALPGAKSFAKRDALLELEKQMQTIWRKERVFEVDAPESATNAPSKFMVTFPFPYMNGRLHLGHSYTLSKADFAAGYQRLKGRKVLFPFGFHCTGMPIKACADKLKHELQENKTQEPGSQWSIMESMGIAPSEISRFTDAQYWLQYFPPLSKRDLVRFGARIDWRRSFLTTPVEPYFDSFVRWQFNSLKAMNLIQFGKRYTIFSPRDGQPCMDHDRKVGEGVAPKEFTLIKMKLKSTAPDFVDSSKSNTCFIGAATLRPETMYGQTNCFVNPDMNYGVYTLEDGDHLICSSHAARNLFHQGKIKEEVPLKVVKGSELIGVRVNAPMSVYKDVYLLPMKSIDPKKGTGFVTSVPSESPHDYVNWCHLKRKPEYFGIRPEWIEGYEPVSVVETDEFGNMSAMTVCTKLNIQSPKDVTLLAKAKDLVYKNSFHQGKMSIGDHAGRPVQEVKEKIKQVLIDNNEAFAYWEPESPVISRSGEECVVSLTDQWYINYSDVAWKEKTRECSERLETYHPEVKAHLLKSLDWLREWACSRTYGLGSYLPWDNKWLIESLSDSTIYPAFYTICHVLQKQNVPVEALTDEVWDYIFKKSPKIPQCSIDKEVLRKALNEFDYFYPPDLRVSGKDLIANHLSFYLFNHTAMFSKQKWPAAIRVNGHLMINKEKMSKSSGNFLTLEDAIERYSADSTRLTLAEAGDGIEDASFDFERANAAILKLHSLKEWMEEQMKHIALKCSVPNIHQRIFEAEVKELAEKADKAYKNMEFQEAAKFGIYEMINARDRYIHASELCGFLPEPKTLEWYMGVQLICMSPITPHFSDYAWRFILHKGGSIFDAEWPCIMGDHRKFLEIQTYLSRLVKNIRTNMTNRLQPRNKKVAPMPYPTDLRIEVAQNFPGWQLDAVHSLQSLEQFYNRDFSDIIKFISSHDATRRHLKNKSLIPFVRLLHGKCKETQSMKPLHLGLSFDETEALDQLRPYLKGVFKVKTIDIKQAEPGKEHIIPGTPLITFNS